MRLPDSDTPLAFIGEPVWNGVEYECGVFPSFVLNPQTGYSVSIIEADTARLYQPTQGDESPAYDGLRGYALCILCGHNRKSALIQAMDYLDMVLE